MSEVDYLPWSDSIDNTKNAKGVTMSAARENLFCGKFPNHDVSLDELEEDSIKIIIQNKKSN